MPQVKKLNTRVGNLGMLETEISMYSDGTSEIEQRLVMNGTGYIIEVHPESENHTLLGSAKDLAELETLVEWISLNSIKDA